MKTISRWSFRLLRWLIVIVVLSWLISRLDLLWPWVIESTYERIQGDPDFDSRLVGYAVLGQRAESVLKTVAPGSKPLYDLISVAKNNENTWKLLTGTLERNAPGTGIALDALALVVEKAAKLTDSFHNAQQLTEVASAITNFRLNPSQASLTILGEQCGGPGAQALSDIRLDVDALADGVRSLNLNFARLMEQLGRAGNSSGLDAQLARALYSSLLALQQPLMEFDHDVQSLRSDLGRDLDTMQSIQWRVILVTKADEVISGIPGLATIRGWARTVWNSLHLALYVAVALLVSGLAFNVGDWYDRRSCNSLRHLGQNRSVPVMWGRGSRSPERSLLHVACSHQLLRWSLPGLRGVLCSKAPLCARAVLELVKLFRCPLRARLPWAVDLAMK
jgi:hypothetical protein